MISMNEFIIRQEIYRRRNMVCTLSEFYNELLCNIDNLSIIIEQHKRNIEFNNKKNKCDNVLSLKDAILPDTPTGNNNNHNTDFYVSNEGIFNDIMNDNIIKENVNNCDIKYNKYISKNINEITSIVKHINSFINDMINEIISSCCYIYSIIEKDYKLIENYFSKENKIYNYFINYRNIIEKRIINYRTKTMQDRINNNGTKNYIFEFNQHASFIKGVIKDLNELF